MCDDPRAHTRSRPRPFRSRAQHRPKTVFAATAPAANGCTFPPSRRLRGSGSRSSWSGTPSESSAARPGCRVPHIFRVPPADEVRAPLSSRRVAPCTSRARSVLRPCARAVLSKRIETQKHRARVRESAHQHGDSSHGPTATRKGRRQVAGANEDGSSPGRACAFRWRQGWSEGAADASDREVQRVFTHFTHSSRQKNDLRCDESGACWARERKCRTAARGVLQYSSASR